MIQSAAIHRTSGLVLENPLHGYDHLYDHPFDHECDHMGTLCAASTKSKQCTSKVQVMCKYSNTLDGLVFVSRSQACGSDHHLDHLMDCSATKVQAKSN